MTAQEKPLDSFLHLSDFHFWEIDLNPLHLLNKRALGMANVLLRRRKEFVMERAEAYSDTVAGLGIERVLLTGDFASTATEGEMAMGAAFARGLEKRGLTPTVLPGNHDVYTFESVRTKRFDRHLGAWMPGGALPALKRLPGGTPMIFVPTVCPNLLSSKGRISEPEIRAVARLLDESESPVVVVGHYPLLNDTYGYTMSAGRRLRGAGALREALGQSGREILYVCGHVHRFSYVRDDVYPSLSHLTTGAFFRTAHESDARGDFSEVRVEAGQFRVFRHQNIGDWVRSEEERREA